MRKDSPPRGRGWYFTNGEKDQNGGEEVTEGKVQNSDGPKGGEKKQYRQEKGKGGDIIMRKGGGPNHHKLKKRWNIKKGAI